MYNVTWYTLGRVVSTPTVRQSKDGKSYSTLYVELFGGMRVSALAGNGQYSKGDYVGVKITPKGTQAAYSIMQLNDQAAVMIVGAHAFLEEPTYRPAVQKEDDDEDLLPF